MTTAVRDSLTLLDKPTATIFVSAHQPYSGVFKKIVVLQTLKNVIERQEGHNRKKVVNLFVIADHDFLDETWIRLAQLPTVKHLFGRLELHIFTGLKKERVLESACLACKRNFQMKLY
jgi:hypothetical protein